VQNEIDNALPTTTVLTLQAGPSQNAIYRLNGYNQTVAGMQISGTGTLNAIVGGFDTLSTLTVNNSGNYTFAGKLGNTGTNENNLALVKSGVGTLTLSGANTYTGATTITAGTLLVNGTHTGGDNYTVSGTLGGTGTITLAPGKTVSVQPGGTLAPGASAGTLTIVDNSMTWASGG
jgi:autotransporter-associated beta strand protein